VRPVPIVTSIALSVVSFQRETRHEIWAVLTEKSRQRPMG
jgi:hypothetical protein